MILFFYKCLRNLEIFLKKLKPRAIVISTIWILEFSFIYLLGTSKRLSLGIFSYDREKSYKYFHMLSSQIYASFLYFRAGCIYFYLFLFYFDYLYRKDTKRLIWRLFENKKKRFWTKWSKKPTRAKPNLASMSYMDRIDCTLGNSTLNGLKLIPIAQENIRVSSQKKKSRLEWEIMIT